MIIFGVDPGTATTGYGVIKSQKSNFSGRLRLYSHPERPRNAFEVI